MSKTVGSQRELNAARRHAAAVLAASEFSSLILGSAFDAAADLRERCVEVRGAKGELPWLVLEFAYFFHFMVSLRLSGALGAGNFEEVSDLTGRYVSTAWVDGFFAGPPDGKAGFIRTVEDGDRTAGAEHAELLRSADSERRLATSLGFLAVRIAQRLNVLDSRELAGHLLAIVPNRLRPDLIEPIVTKYQQHVVEASRASS